MRFRLQTMSTAFLSIALLGMAFVARTATAQCAFPVIAGSIQPRSAQDATSLEPGQREADARDGLDEARHERKPKDARIVGFWKAKFVSEGSTGIPDGTVIDDAFVQWHEDGTELMNSSRPPATGNVCLGVWESSGHSEFALNHFGLSFDAAQNAIGPAQIHERVVLQRGADRYDGTFTIDQYDLSGNLLAHIQGRITARRLTIDSSVEDVF